MPNLESQMRKRLPDFTKKPRARTGFVFHITLIIAITFGLVCVTTYSAKAQTTATLGGTVADPTGAVIPNAAIQLKNVASGDVRTAESNGSGVFTFSGVPSGDYSIRIEAKGFNVLEQTGIHLDPGDQRAIRGIKLSVGKDTESVVVKDGGSQINVDSGELSNTISAADIKQLPVGGRDVTELVKILPGMAIQGNSSNRTFDPSITNFTGALGNYAGNGAPINSTSMLIDGADISDPGTWGSSIQNVNFAQVAEVKVTTGSFTAEAPHGPIVVSAVGKSGGDQYHGSLYAHGRTYQLNSIDWEFGALGQPKPSDWAVYPGFTIGGPLYIPHLYPNHSKKLTFFLGSEAMEQRNAFAYNWAPNALVEALVPTAGMRKGDFSETQIAEYLGAFYQPSLTNGQCASGSSLIYEYLCPVPQTSPSGTQIANGDISAYIDPVAQSVINLLPLPNKATDSNGYNYAASNLVNYNLYQTRVRFDYKLSDRNRIFSSYSVEDGNQAEPGLAWGPTGTSTQGRVNTPGGGLTSTLQSHVMSLNWNSVISPTMANEFFGAWGYYSNIFYPRNPSAVLGNPYTWAFNTQTKALPQLASSGTLNSGSSSNGLPNLNFDDPTFGHTFSIKQMREVGDNLTKQLGVHTLRAGVFYQWVISPSTPDNQNTNGLISTWQGVSQYTDPIAGTVYNTDQLSSNCSGTCIYGNTLANFMEGHIGQFSQQNVYTKQSLYLWNLSGYVQDHYRMTSHLSVDMGVRLEHMTPWEDSTGVGLATFDPKSYAKGFPSQLPGILTHKIDHSIPNGGRDVGAVWIEPRAGFSWIPFGREDLAVRGGFGIYRQHDADFEVTPASQTAQGMVSEYACCNMNLSSVHAFSNNTSGVSAGGLNSSSLVYDTYVSALYRGDKDSATMYTYNLAIEKKFPHGIIIDAAYAGNRGLHLTDWARQNINALPVGALFYPQPDAGRTDTADRNGLSPSIFLTSGGGANTSLQWMDVAHMDAYRPYPDYWAIYTRRHVAKSNYNSLQVALLQNGHHSRVGSNFTWSKALGNNYGTDQVNAKNNYNLEPFDRRYMVNVTYAVWTGDWYKKNKLGFLLNGWDMSGWTGFQSGPSMPAIYNNNFNLGGTLTLPYGVVATNPINGVTSSCTTMGNPCNLWASNTMILGSPDQVIQPKLIASAKGHGHNEYVNPNAFALPAVGTNGDYHLGHIPGPAFFNSDISAGRRFRVNDKSGLTFRASAFNFLNYANKSFDWLFPNQVDLNYNQTLNSMDLNSALGSARNTNTLFGKTTMKTGRRVVEFSLNYEF